MNSTDLMKSKLPVLEYSVVGKTSRKKGKWTFRFKTPAGAILMESAFRFGSRAEAERGFVSVIKSVATNQYNVQYQEQSSKRFGCSTRNLATCGGRPRRSLEGSLQAHR